MSKIGDVFKFTKQIIKHSPAIEKQPALTNDQVLKSVDVEGADDNAADVIKQVKKEVVEPIADFVEQYPNLNTFITAMVAGGVAGFAVKKAEEKKETTEYLEKLQKFTNKADSLNVGEKISLTLAVNLGYIALALASLAIGAPYLGAGKAGLMALGGLGAVNLPFILKKNPHKLSKDGKFLKTGPHEFVTIPPSGDKLIFCRILRDSDGKKPIPEKIINLNGKLAKNFSGADDSFYVNYKDGGMSSFSFSGNRIKDYKDYTYDK